MLYVSVTRPHLIKLPGLMRHAAGKAKLADRVQVPVDRLIAVERRTVGIGRGERAAPEQVEAVSEKGLSCGDRRVDGFRAAGSKGVKMRERGFDVLPPARTAGGQPGREGQIRGL